MEKKEGIWDCNVCGKMSDRKDLIKRHAETLRGCGAFLSYLQQDITNKK